MKILIINGPNLNMLGKRDPEKYGEIKLREINEQLAILGKKHNVKLEFFQSNHEGAIIDFLQKESSRNADGILINPGALTHYGYSLRDALIDSKLPIIEIHLSNIQKREDFRRVDVLEGLTVQVVMGKKEKSYSIGLQKLIKYIHGSHTLSSPTP